MDPVLSICLITYNHEAYIRDALDGVFMQKVNFPFELIIADDFSTDGTREIIKEFKDKHPETIRLIFQERNVGPARNWMDLITSPLGKYIAYFEGDDFWTDPNKLQTQIDFLETNPTFVGCFHNTEERYEGDYTKASFLYCNFSGAKEHTFSDITFSNAMPTCSVIFKNHLIDKYPDFFFQAKLGDWLLHLLNAQHGDYYYIPTVMAVHRLHVNSVWGMQDHQKNVLKIQNAYELMIDSGYFSDEHTELLKTGFQTFTTTHFPVKKSVLQKVAKRLADYLNRYS
ncbi:glycosyltransferase [Imperialibacter roseus]|uniref:Glycosyltransferase n=1 Tax=Imperialibacter roseus TaxID=1324217 RepID=A0ABZ0IPB4_9BACT|nr:glycosyltransferase [Imperialibacter roseus]WOK06293.1 glycosyltransferase [Imperialibacter roseus]